MTIPDLLTHILVGISLALVLQKQDDRESFSILLLGSIIFDIDRPIGWVLGLAGFEIQWLISGFHSLIGLILLCFFAASLFDIPTLTWNMRFRLLIIGAVSHLLLDMTMWPWEEHGLLLLFPLRIPFSFHLFWSDFAFYPLVGIALLLSSFGFLVARNATNWRDGK